MLKADVRLPSRDTKPEKKGLQSLHVIVTGDSLCSSDLPLPSLDDKEFWRYFQNASDLALVLRGGADAVIGRTEARQLLANFRGIAVESIAKTDSGLRHICGLNVRQLRDFLADIWRMGGGIAVLRDLSVGSTKGTALTALLQSQRKRIEEHIRSHSVSLRSVSAVVCEEDLLELGIDCGTTAVVRMPELSPFGHLSAFSAYSDFDDDAKFERPTLPEMRRSELLSALNAFESERMSAFDSERMSASFGEREPSGFRRLED